MSAQAYATTHVLHLSLVLGRPVSGRAGGKLGRVDDLVVRLGDAGYPPVTAALATVAGRSVFVPADSIAEIDEDGLRLTTDRLDLRPFERRPQEVLLAKDVLDRQLIDVDGARLRRANDIELARLEGWWRVVGVDVGPRGIIRRVVPRRYAERLAGEATRLLDWASVEPFTGHVPTVRLNVPHPKLVRLHPAQIADLVEAAATAEGEEILAAVHDDPELEADLFEELEDSRAGELLEDRPDEEIAAVLCAHGVGRRRRPARRARRGPRRRHRQAPADRPAPARPHAARPRPRHRGRPDEPGVRLRLRPGDRCRGARAAAPLARRGRERSRWSS